MKSDRVAEATLQVRYGGEPVGSAFRFLRDDIVITSGHTLHPITEGVPITAVVERGTEIELDLITISPEPRAGGHDYAILRADAGFSTEGDVLHPMADAPSRGDEVFFAGHPFDIADTLVHKAIVSGPHEHGFYLDGTVNLGNSGGPIVDKDTGDVVGIITKSRIYQSQSLEEVIDHLIGVQQQLSRIQEVHQTTINRVGVGDLAMDTIQEIQDALDILTDNVSSGIGVGYSIDYVLTDLEDTESS